MSERPSESQPISSPTHPSEDQPKPQPDPSPRPSPSIPIPDSNPEGSVESERIRTEDQVSTVKPDEGTDKPKVSTDKIDEGTTKLKNGNSDENATLTATPIVFRDDETIAEFLARIEVDSILAARLQEEEREKFTIKERAKLLHDTIAAQRKFLPQQRASKIRNGRKEAFKLKTKNFKEIQVLYEKVKRSDENFIAIGSAEDERLIKDVNKKATGTKKDDSIKKESKEEKTTYKDKEVDYEILDKKYPIIEWKSEYLGNKPQFDKSKELMSE
ncbi:hypothetical protein Tco_0163808 [Tanacetum coccineum]